jgi:NCAIR mutase (PurE)-related protein
VSSGAANEVLLDFGRGRRTGLDEAVLAMSKSCAQLEVILSRAEERGARLLLTRLSPAQHAQLAPRWTAQLDYCSVSQTAFFGAIAPVAPVSRVAIVAGGSSDAAVVREAERALTYYGFASQLHVDVGVAGLWRLLQRIDELRRFPVVIAIAGMDAALPTVLAGLVPGVIIAVPTSVGYGAAEGGRTALHALLASCAQGITVVNIDNGFGAACAAVRALRARQWDPGSPASASNAASNEALTAGAQADADADACAATAPLLVTS